MVLPGGGRYNSAYTASSPTPSTQCSALIMSKTWATLISKIELLMSPFFRTETGKYASYCASALEKCVKNGPRSAKPSRMEVLSILLKNPHHHSLPHAVPVHMLNNTYHVVGFDGSTTIAEFLHTLNLDIGCRGIELSGFTIFSDDPIEKNVDHCLNQQDKVCDVISRWETALREKGSGKFENKRVIRFTYKNRMFWR